MSNVDINVDRRTDGQKIGRLYRTLLQAGAIKRRKEIVEEMTAREREERGSGMKVKKQKK